MSQFVIQMSNGYYMKRRQVRQFATPHIYAAREARDAQKFPNQKKANERADWLRSWNFQVVRVTPLEEATDEF